MDSVLKLVYDNWTDAGFPLPNGRHPVINHWLRADIKSNSRETWSHSQNVISEHVQGNCFMFDHSNFWTYFKRYHNRQDFVRVEQVTDDDSVYVWPIEIRTGVESVSATHRFTLSGKTTEYSIKDTINPLLLQLMQRGRVKIAINYAHDPADNMNSIKAIETYFDAIGVDGSNIVFIPGNDCSQEYKQYFPEGKLQISATKLLMGQQLASDILTFPRETTLGYVSDIVRATDLDYSKTRSKRFLCFNRTMRPHRYILGYIALKLNLLDTSIFSFLNKFDHTTSTVKGEIKSFGFTDGSKFAQAVYDLIPYELDTQHLSQHERQGFNSVNSKQSWFSDTYVHITSETRFIHGETPFVSEKTWKPIANLQPFIMVGNYGTLAYLKQLGFKTFSPFIDESYDDETDYKQRISKIYDEIARLNAMPLHQLHDWYYSITEILLHNQQLLIDMGSINPYEETFTYLKGN